MAKQILQINSVVNKGSTGKIAEEIGDVAIQRGWDSYIAFGRGGRSSSSKLINVEGKLRISNFVDLAFSRILDNQGFNSRIATSKLISEINFIKPDIVHLHNLHGYYLNCELLFKFLGIYGKPVIWTLHDCWPFTGHCAYFDYIGCEKWKTHCVRCPQKQSYPASFVLDNSRKNFERKRLIFNELDNLTLIPVSFWLSSLLEKSYLAGINKRVIHNGIDLDSFTIRSKITDTDFQGKFLILGVASVWEKRKGFEEFIRLSKIINEDMLIILVGLNGKQKADLPNNIIALDKINSSKKLSSIYSSVDVFVNPTFEDNYPTTNMEAIACGTPVIAYNTGGCKEQIHPDVGFIVPKHDISAILESCLVIKSRGSNSYNQVCRAYAVTNFSGVERFNEYINLYESLL